MNPISIIPAKRRVRRRRKTVSPLLLVSAWYDPAVAVELNFDRTIDLSGLVASQIIVDDAEFEDHRYQATGEFDQFSPTSVYLYLEPVGSESGDETFLVAGPGNGIVAIGDGGAWAGVNHLLLPFP